MAATADESGELRRQQALLERVEELAQIGGWDWRPDQGEVVWSANLFRIFGFAPGAVAPSEQLVLERAHPEDRARVRSALDQLRRRGRPRRLDFRIVRPDGEVRHVRATVTVLQDGGPPERIIGSVQDRTGELRAERELAAHHAVSEALAGWSGLASGGPALLEALATAVGSTRGVLWVPAEERLEPAAIWGDPPAIVHHPRRGRGPCGRAWSLREPVAAGRALAVPAVRFTEVLAVLEVTGPERVHVDDRLMRMLTGIAHLLGHFFDRRRGDLRPPILSPRQGEILRLAARGGTVAEIGAQLHISASTVKRHLESSYERLGANDRASAVAAALRAGHIS